MGKKLSEKELLEKIAYRVMREKGLEPEFPDQVEKELANIKYPSMQHSEKIRDLRHLLWISIDNDDSLDLDQLTTVEIVNKNETRIYIAIADVDSKVKKGSAIDHYAAYNTTSVYTAAKIFPMLPEILSNNLTSLNPAADRLAVVTEILIDEEGNTLDSSVYRAKVRNKAKLTYNSVAEWLEKGAAEGDYEEINRLFESIELHYKISEKLKDLRRKNGSLDFETIRSRPVFKDDRLEALETDEDNIAKDIIEEFMIAANMVTARFLEENDFPSIRRIVKNPKRWERIIELAHEHGSELPAEPDSKSLEIFLVSQKEKSPETFPDLSLSVIKLMGKGEYSAVVPGEKNAGHFGLAVKEYSHSTAPNRRYPDLIAQRLIKAALKNQKCPYAVQELSTIASQCTKMEEAAKKVERHLEKSAAALFLKNMIGKKFPAIVTGASSKGVWVRLKDFPVEGKLKNPPEYADIGISLTVKLISTDAEKGFIDFKQPG